MSSLGVFRDDRFSSAISIIVVLFMFKIFPDGFSIILNRSHEDLVKHKFLLSDAFERFSQLINNWCREGYMKSLVYTKLVGIGI